MEDNNNNKNDNLDTTKKARKQKIKKKIGKKLISMLPGAIPAILIFVAAIFVLGIFGEVGNVFKEIASSIKDFFTVDFADGAILIDDDKIDTIINGIYEIGVDPAELKLLGDVEEGKDANSPEYQEALRKYIKKFYEAQAVTETLNFYHIASGNDRTYGAVYVYRLNEGAEDVSDRFELTFKKYEDMLEMQEDDDINARNFFSIDDDGKIVIAGTTETIVNGKSTVDVTLRSINYKSAISQYTTQMQFLVYLTMISQNPEFVSAVVDLIKDSRIELTVMDNVSTFESTEIYTYDSNTDDGVTNSDYAITTVPGVTERTETKIINTNPSAQVTYVRTWFCEQSVEYNRVETKSETEPHTVTLPNETRPSGAGSWKTNQSKVISDKTTEVRYEEGIRGDVKIIVGESGDSIRYTNGEIQQPTFVGLLETEFRIPNSTRKEVAGSNIVSGADMLFYLLQQDATLENMENIMRYALNKYTDSDKYGEGIFDNLLTSLEIRMTQVGIGYIVDTRRSDSEIVIHDVDTLEQAIESLYSGQARQNLLNEASTFIEMQTKYNVNAVFAIAVTIVESSGGTNWAAIAPETHNWMSLTGSYKGQTYRNPNSGNSRTWRVYPNFTEATLDFGDLIANSSYYFQNGKYTVTDIAPTYCNAEWGTRVSAEMTKFYKAAGIDISSIVATEGGVTTDGEAQALQYQIENEWINTKVHNKNGLYQQGPFAKYWDTPYNNLEPFQCTWWANGRASMYLEMYGTKYHKYPTQRGHGGSYYDINAQNGWFEYGSVPRPNSIISWKHGTYGHVAYVEGVASDGIYISHAGSGESWYGVQKIPLDGTIWNYGKPNGYIYLDSPK